MLYANLDEAYNIPINKKKKKKKDNKIEFDTIESYDKFEKSDTPLINFDKGRDIQTYKTTLNHCEPLQAPPYRFPIEEEAKIHYDNTINNMNTTFNPNNNNFTINDNTFDPNQNINDNYYGINYDNYLNNIDDYYEKNNNNYNQLNNNKKKKQNNKIKNILDNDNDKTYEILLLLIMAILIILMCEIIVRIVS